MMRQWLMIFLLIGSVHSFAQETAPQGSDNTQDQRNIIIWHTNGEQTLIRMATDAHIVFGDGDEIAIEAEEGTLRLDAADVKKITYKPDTADAIHDARGDENPDRECFSINGMRVSFTGLKPGVYIVHAGKRKYKFVKR